MPPINMWMGHAVDSILNNRTAAVLIVDASSSTRQMMSSSVRSLGFSNVIGAQSLEEAIGIMSGNSIAWLITSLFQEDKVNAFHILQVAQDKEVFGDLRVTLFVAQNELQVLPRAFSLGLF